MQCLYQSSLRGPKVSCLFTIWDWFKGMLISINKFYSLGFCQSWWCELLIFHSFLLLQGTWFLKKYVKKPKCNLNLFSHFITCQNNCCKNVSDLASGPKVGLFTIWVWFKVLLISWGIFNFSMKINAQIFCEFYPEEISGSNCNHFLQLLFWQVTKWEIQI